MVWAIKFLAGSSFARDQHALCVAGDPVHHAHESVHHRAGEYKIGAVNLARDGVRRVVFSGFRLLVFC